MNTGLKVAISGIGAFLLYEYGKGAGWFGAAAPVPAPTGGGGGAAATTPSTSGTTTTTPTTTPPTTPPASGSWDAFAAGVAKAGYTQASALSCDTWCFYWNQANPNTPCPDPLQGCIPQVSVTNLANCPAGSSLANCAAGGTLQPGPRDNPVYYGVWRAWMKASGMGTLFRNRRVPVRHLRGTGYVSQNRPMFGWRSYGR